MTGVPIGQGFEVTAPLAQGFSLGVPAPGVLVFQPGGTRAGNVYTTTALLQQAAASMGPGLTILLDFSHSADTFTPAAGTLNLGPDATIEGLPNPTTGVLPTLNLSNATTIAPMPVAWRNLTINDATAGPVVTNGAGQGRLTLENVTLSSGAAGPFLAVAHNLIIESLGATTFGDGTNPTVQINAGTLVTQCKDQTTVQANSFLLVGGFYEFWMLASTVALAVSYAVAGVLVMFVGIEATFPIGGDPNGVVTAVQRGWTLFDPVKFKHWIGTFDINIGLASWTGVEANVLFLPAGLESATVFTTWPLLCAYLVGQQTQKLVTCDFTQNANTFDLPAGASDFGTTTELHFIPNTTSGAVPQLTASAGSTWTSAPVRLSGVGLLEITQVGTPLLTNPGGANGGTLEIVEDVTVQSVSGAAPFLSETATRFNVNVSGRGALGGLATLKASGAGAWLIEAQDSAFLGAAAVDFGTAGSLLLINSPAVVLDPNYWAATGVTIEFAAATFGGPLPAPPPILSFPGQAFATMDQAYAAVALLAAQVSNPTSLFIGGPSPGPANPQTVGPYTITGFADGNLQSSITLSSGAPALDQPFAIFGCGLIQTGATSPFIGWSGAQVLTLRDAHFSTTSGVLFPLSGGATIQADLNVTFSGAGCVTETAAPSTVRVGKNCTVGAGSIVGSTIRIVDSTASVPAALVAQVSVAAGVAWHAAIANPNGTVHGDVGAMFVNTAGGVGSTLWVNTNGGTTWTNIA